MLIFGWVRLVKVKRVPQGYSPPQVQWPELRDKKTYTYFVFHGSEIKKSERTFVILCKCKSHFENKYMVTFLIILKTA